MLFTLTGCRWWVEIQARNDVIRAEANAQMIIIEAEARLQAEIAHAEAEVVRAQGVADAMYIVNDAITPMYLHHFWIRTMADHGNTIYIATEAGLPVFNVVDD